MTFEKDIFISYAHIDNMALKEGEKGWVANFHRSLGIRLTQLMGEKPNVWRDQKLQGNDIFGDEITGQFPETAIMISILSPGYIKSQWCIKEMRKFYKVAEEGIGIKIGNKLRIFKVVKTPVPYEEHPPEIADILGYEFFVSDPHSERLHELNQKCGGELEHAYWEKLNDIAYDICDLLRKLEQNGETGITNQCPHEKITVYLAETSIELKKQRDMIKRQLIESGCRVLPDTRLPTDEAAFKNSVDHLLGQCSLSIHLVGGDYGPVPRDSQESIIHIQSQLAVEKCKTGKLQRLIWLPSGHYEKISDLREKEFVRQLRTNPEFQYGADFFETHFQDFKFAMRDKVENLSTEKIKIIEENRHENKEEETIAPVELDGMPRQIYLICERKDLEHVTKLEDLLFDSGYDVITPAFEGDEEELMQDHFENLKSCDAAIIYYGAGSDLWMRAISRDFKKITGYGRGDPLRVRAVFLAPPVTQAKERFRSHGFLTVNGMKEISSPVLKPIMEGLNALQVVES